MMHNSFFLDLWSPLFSLVLQRNYMRHSLLYSTTSWSGDRRIEGGCHGNTLFSLALGFSSFLQAAGEQFFQERLLGVKRTEIKEGVG